MTRLLLAVFAALPYVSATPSGSRHAPALGQQNHAGWTSSWNLTKFTTLVAFGDSYTDDSRLNYFIAHQGQAPPVGWVDSANYASASGGRPWPEYVKQYTGINLYDYAVSGAVCSNDVTPREFSLINGPFPAVAQYEVPAYIADSKYIEPNGTKFLIEPQDETIYSIWIGTNDLGVNAFITDSQVKGKNIVDYTSCVFDSIKRVYDNGGRYFVLQNVAPLNLAPLYALPSEGGVTADQYWSDKPSNITEISERMMEQVVTVNAIFEYQAPFQAIINQTMPNIKIAVMNMHGLITDIYNNPSQYLNGTAPLQVDVADQQCNLTSGACMRTDHPDSFLWFDDLHPSEQTDRVIAREFVKVVEGGSKWATYWG